MKYLTLCVEYIHSSSLVFRHHLDFILQENLHLLFLRFIFCYIAMPPLTMGVCSEKFIVRRFCHCENIIECAYTNLDGITYYTPRLYGGSLSFMRSAIDWNRNIMWHMTVSLVQYTGKKVCDTFFKALTLKQFMSFTATYGLLFSVSL